MKRSSFYLLLFLCLLSALGTGYHMYSLTQQEMLWGHWPLLLFLSFVGFLVVLRSGTIKKRPQHFRWLGLSTLSGVLLSIGFPPLPLPILLFAGFVPLLLVEQEISLTSDNSQKKAVLRYAYHAFLVWNILTTFWVTNTAFIAGLIAIFANAFLMSIPFVLYHQCKKSLRGRLALFGFISLWITFEYLHMRWELSWPWLTLGNGLARFPELAQWYSFTGVGGGSLWILLGNFFLFKNLDGIRRFQPKPIAALAVIVLFPAVLSLVQYFSYQEKGETVDVVVVQPNFEPHYEKFEVSESAQLARFLNLSEQALTDSVQYLIFPETSFGQVDTNQVFKKGTMRRLKSFIDEYPELQLISGVGGIKIYKEDEPHSPAVRVLETKNGPLYWEAYNAAIQLSSSSEEVSFYLKSILVPGAELFPYRDVLFFLKPIVEALDGAVIYGSQAERSVFRSPHAAVGPIICYESIFGEYVTGYVRKGAEFLMIGTNDGWWDDTAGHRQHLMFASLRAIETRRSIARSANTGVSAFINQRGDILQPTAYGMEAAIRGRVHLNRDITFYVIWGDIIGRVSLFASILLLLNAFVKGWMRKTEIKSAQAKR